MKTAFFGLGVIGLILCSILFGAICFNVGGLPILIIGSFYISIPNLVYLILLQIKENEQ